MLKTRNNSIYWVENLKLLSCLLILGLNILTSCTSKVVSSTHSPLKIEKFYKSLQGNLTKELDTLKVLNWLEENKLIRNEGKNIPYNNEKITLNNDLILKGNKDSYVLIGYEYEGDFSALYPWKSQFLFAKSGGLAIKFNAESYEIVNTNDVNENYLLLTYSTAKGNGSHALYKIESDSCVNLFSDKIFKFPNTVDCDDTNGKYIPCQLNHSVTDVNLDGYYDISFRGTWNGLGDPIPIVFDFIYDPTNLRFHPAEDYFLKYPFLQ